MDALPSPHQYIISTTEMGVLSDIFYVELLQDVVWSDQAA